MPKTTMKESERLAAALMRKLEEKEKEYKELEKRFHSFLDSYKNMEDKTNACLDEINIGETLKSTRNPIYVNNLDPHRSQSYAVLEQGRVYSLFYDECGERQKLYFAPMAYYPADRLLECYFVFDTREENGNEKLFLHTGIPHCRYYNNAESMFPDYAQTRDYMLALDYSNMNIVNFHNDTETKRLKAMVSKLTPRYMLLSKILPHMNMNNEVRLIIPDYIYLQGTTTKPRSTNF